jgi:nitroimidazol reductase NimA-like FMN-containing flavoprotein (pyridoxamine 5'-phosphate oxidase superfamily)
MKLLENQRQVCVEIEEYKPDLSEFQFVMLKGSLEMVTDPLEREEAICRIAEQGRQVLSTNFLIAHGFKEEDDWSSFTPARPLTIVKLTPKIESGLKSR